VQFNYINKTSMLRHCWLGDRNGILAGC